ncbi:MAG TPA: CocE/NonD family hydrolase, partial [Acidimicrobiales bacterium]
VFATIPMGDAYRDITFAGGQVNAAFIPLWMGLVSVLSVANATEHPDALLDHVIGLPGFQLSTVLQAVTGGEAAYDGPFWQQRSPLSVADEITAPTFIVGGLDDIFQRGEPLLYEALADHTDARLLLGPWAHITAGQGLPADGVPSTDALRLQWFDAHVRGLDSGVECVPEVMQYVRGVDEYRSAPAWPVPDLAAQRWYLQGDGTLDGATPPEAGPGRDYLQLPVTGVCTRSTNQWLIGALSGSPCETDNRLDESVPGALTYTSEPFGDSTYVNGPIQADLWLRPTTDEALVSVAVSDVAPDGTSRGLTNGLLSASHRAVDPERSRMLDGQSVQPWHPFGRVDVLPVVPGEAIHVPVEVFPTSAVIRPGHRLRVTISAYDVPHALPPIPAALSSLGGPVTVLSDAAHPSSIVLPVVSELATELPTGDDGATVGDAPPPPIPAADEPDQPVSPVDGRPAAAGGTSVLGVMRPASTTSPSRPDGTALALLAAVLVTGAGLCLRRRATRPE